VGDAEQIEQPFAPLFEPRIHLSEHGGDDGGRGDGHGELRPHSAFLKQIIQTFAEREWAQRPKACALCPKAGALCPERSSAQRELSLRSSAGCRQTSAAS